MNYIGNQTGIAAIASWFFLHIVIRERPVNLTTSVDIALNQVVAGFFPPLLMIAESQGGVSSACKRSRSVEFISRVE